MWLIVNIIIDDIRKCFEHELGNKHETEVLKFGMGEFDRNESKQSHNTICADLQKNFQNIFVNNLTWLVFRT